MVALELYTNGYSQEQRERLHSRLGRKPRLIVDPSESWDSGIICQLCSDAKPAGVMERELLCSEVASCLADFIVDDLEGELIWHYIHKDGKSYSLEDQQIIFDFCIELLQDDEKWSGQISRSRKEKLIDAFLEYLLEYSAMNLFGFVNFRLKYYLDDLRAVVHYAMEEFHIEEQYQEFIALLKYFVFAQEIKRAAVHIVHREGNEFMVLDENYKPIEVNDLRELVVETIDKEMNMEDMIISTLITVSPKTVYIHTSQPEQQIIRTIQYIFEERAILC